MRCVVLCFALFCCAVTCCGVLCYVLNIQVSWPLGSEHAHLDQFAGLLCLLHQPNVRTYTCDPFYSGGHWLCDTMSCHVLSCQAGNVGVLLNDWHSQHAGRFSGMMVHVLHVQYCW